MKKISKVILVSLAVLALLVSAACKSNRKKVDPVVTPQTTESTAPDIEAPPARTDTPVEPTRDFVREETPQEVVPTDIEQLNKWARDKGYIRDAFYNYDEATLDDAAQNALQASATWLKGEGAAYNLLVEGHCDERGTEQYNLALGDRRAYSAKEYLTTLGINAGRIRTVSYGEERPFEEGHDDASWSQNRRAHLVLVQAR
ncbi:MAG TPA: OmpA family protein [Thermoanaerobaculia bacterium]|nr:OmpA family protein [Thermoanaerobaculia bacterium]